MPLKLSMSGQIELIKLTLPPPDAVHSHSSSRLFPGCDAAGQGKTGPA